MKKSTYNYANYTYNSKNPLVRFAHRKRIKTAIQLISSEKIQSLLDYGCGDGKFLSELIPHYPQIHVVGFDPLSEPKKINEIKLFNNLKAINPNEFDSITCFEVLEHFNSKGQKQILSEIKSLLKKEGFVIISVPIEIGFPSLIKNLRRLTISPGKYYNIKNTIKCFFGKPVSDVRKLDGFIPSHVGFNHIQFEKTLKENFVIKNKIFSPFSDLGYQLNSQVFYKLEFKP